MELAVRRAGFRTLLLSVALEQDRLARALRGASPAAIVLAGPSATLDVVGRIVYAARRVASTASVLEYREATPVAGSHSIPSLGATPSEAVAALRELVEGPAATSSEQGRPEVAAREPAARRQAVSG
jgi:hypothetical protein